MANGIVERPRNAYQWRSGTVFRADANEVGKRLEALAELHNGQLTTDVIVQEATATDSPLYPLFEHDIAKAARHYTEHQARAIVGSLVVVTIIPAERKTTKPIEGQAVTVEVESEVTVRAFPNVIANGQQFYTPLQAVLSNGALRDQYANSLLREIKSWGRKAADFQMFFGLVKAIAELPESVESA